MNNKFNVAGLENRIQINKDEEEITIYKNLDNNIYFTGNKNKETKISLNVGSFDYNEFKTYHIFYDLMKSIIGKYILQDYKPYYNGLPEDFVNIENKEIICHTDSEPTSYLKMKLDNGTLSISIVKEKHLDSTIIQNSVKIASHGSQYGNYHNEFYNFYSELYNYGHSIKKENSKQKRLQK